MPLVAEFGPVFSIQAHVKARQRGYAYGMVERLV